ncbi:TPA: hypothetical protein ACJI3N_005323 [Raoultella planticola]
MVLTDKQKSIVKTLYLGYERGKLLYLDELLELLPYQTTKQSIQFSIRALIKKKLVEKHECLAVGETLHKRRVLGLTAMGRAKAKILLTK